MECKECFIKVDFNRVTVLIETLWNVKFNCNTITFSVWIVLIETLWNVKIEEQPKQPTVAEGINRNIVECKVKKTGTYQPGGAVLIETLWNVKSIT